MSDTALLQPDPRSPFVLDVHDLGRHPGSMRAVSIQASAPPQLTLEMIGIPEGSALQLDLRIESVSEGVLISGTVFGNATGECARCLRPITEPFDVRVQELYAYPGSITQETADEDEVSQLVGDLLDLEPVIRDAVLLALPSTPYCRPDCPGLCPECGQHFDDLPANHTHTQLDPRWAALLELTDTAESSSQDLLGQQELSADKAPDEKQEK